jgi:hypothetical protein
MGAGLLMAAAGTGLTVTVREAEAVQEPPSETVTV